jgi:hypothetical protein
MADHKGRFVLRSLTVPKNITAKWFLKSWMKKCVAYYRGQGT